MVLSYVSDPALAPRLVVSGKLDLLPDVAMTRPWVEAGCLLLLTQNAVGQEANARARTGQERQRTAFAIPRPQTDSLVRSRIVASDGRVLITRAEISSGLVWLAPEPLMARDSSTFRISVVGGRLVALDWFGRCLAATPGESRVPLTFDDCRREPPRLEPIDDPELPLEQGRFRLRSGMGYIGPSATSSLLFPRSDAETWFRLERVFPEPRLP